MENNEEDEVVAVVKSSSNSSIAEAVMATKTTSRASPTPVAGTPIEADLPSSGLSSPNDDLSMEVSRNVFKFEKENGRTYHGFRPGTYHFPNDPTETERLDFQFEIIKFCFSNRNYFAPLSSPKRILDIGTGTGQWAIEIADEFPSAEVQATDLSPIQPSSVPENVQFFIDDAAEEDWAVPPAYFDFIHSRVLAGCFEDFGVIVQRAFYYLKPGGWIESQEMMSKPHCDDGTMPYNWPFLDWSRLIDSAAEETGRPLRIANKLKGWYEAAGFVDVQEKLFKIPMNPWPKDKHLKTLGRMQEDNIVSGLGGLSMAYFSRVLGWSKNEIEVYLVGVRKSVSDREVHAYHKVFVVWGRKPFNHEVKGKQAEPPSSSKSTFEAPGPSTRSAATM